MDVPINWGILGAGKIADRFITDFKKVNDGQIVAIASRSVERAQAFSARHGIPRAYDDYESMVRDPGIDVIYIATTHNFHKQHALLCLQNDKHVLCEKPFATNAAEAREMIACARENGLFLMEAMWMKFNPAYQQVMRWIEDGLIGKIQMLKADFGFRAPWEPENRLLNPELAGGALLDVGVYPVALASQLFNAKPTLIEALAFVGTTGVDEQTGIVLKYSHGQLAMLTAAIQTQIPNNALILGTQGMIWIPSFWCSRMAVLWRRNKLPLFVLKTAGYQFEAAEVNQCIRQGIKESKLMPHAETLMIMETMDSIREKINLHYPSETNLVT